MDSSDQGVDERMIKKNYDIILIITQYQNERLVNIVTGRKTCEYTCEPVWPSGKALGWQAEGPRFESACGLWSLPCDFVPHN